MPRVLVVAETPDHQTFLDEQVSVIHLEDAHSADQITERLVWAVHDAEEAQVVATGLATAG